MAKTLREKYIEALKAKSYEEVNSRSSKYVVFRRDAEFYFYIGKSGSLRIGRTITGSVPVTKAYKNSLLEMISGH